MVPKADVPSEGVVRHFGHASERNLEHTSNWDRFLLLCVGVFFVIVIPTMVTDDYFRHMIIMVLFFAYMSSAYNIISGYSGRLSLGHSAYLGIGAYTSTIMFTQFGISPWVGMLAGGAAAVVTSFAIGYPCFRLNIRGPYFALTTLGFSELMRIYFSNTQAVFGLRINGSMGILIEGRGQSFANFQFMDKLYYYYIILAMLLIVVLFTCYLERSKIGYYLKAIKGSQSAAQALGTPHTRVNLKANAASAFFTGVGGVFYAQWIQFISPERVLSLPFSTDFLVICMVGGFGTVLGPVLGAFLMIPAGEVARVYFGSTYLGTHLVLYGIVLILSLYFLPNGLVKPLSEQYGEMLKKLRGLSMWGR